MAASNPLKPFTFRTFYRKNIDQYRYVIYENGKIVHYGDTYHSRLIATLRAQSIVDCANPKKVTKRAVSFNPDSQ
jgi:hypothetical protein